MGDVTSEKLLGVLARVRPGARSVVELRRLSGGASLESWSFALEVDAADHGAMAERFVLRRAPQLAGAASADDPPTTMAMPLASEAELIRQAGAGGVVVPDVVVELEEADELGVGFVMAHVDGETIPQRILRDPDLDDARNNLAGQCGQALAGIHAIAIDGLPELRRVDGPATIDQLEEQLDGFGHPSPVFAAALRWLKDQARPIDDPVLVHGDFRHGNLMIDRRGLAAVLDWELAHLGDPMEDLGWLCAPSWRFGKMDRAVGGFGDRPQLFEAYQAATGREVDPAQVTFWEAVATLKWGVICLMMYTSFETGLNRSVERAAIGRRVSETEIDLVDMMFGLEPTDPATPSPTGTPGSGDGAATISAISPSAGELLQAVERFLREEAMPGLEGRSAFLARVAANAVATVGRELEMGPSAGHRELRGIDSLMQLVNGESDRKSGADGDGEPVPDPDGGVDDTARRLIAGRRSLSAAISGGGLAFDHPELIAHLRATVVDAVAIDQPRYGTYAALQQD